ncbi:DUF2934 domain-containing protein [Agrobacterium rosae]
MSNETDRHAKAYALWEKEGRPEGRHLDHWHAAETTEADDGSEAQLSEQNETSAGEDPVEGSEQIVDLEVAHQQKRPKRSAG